MGSYSTEFEKLALDSHAAAMLDGCDELVRDFNVQAGQHEDQAPHDNTLDGLVDNLLGQLDRKIR